MMPWTDRVVLFTPLALAVVFVAGFMVSTVSVRKVETAPIASAVPVPTDRDLMMKTAVAQKNEAVRRCIEHRRIPAVGFGAVLCLDGYIVTETRIENLWGGP